MLAASLCAPAQVAVRVVDAATGEPIPFAHVVPQGSDGGAEQVGVTGLDGRCAIAQAAQARVSCVGFVPQSVALAGREEQLVRLQRDATALNEVVVTGQYAPGTAEGAVHRLRVIDAERLQRMAAQNLGDALRDQLNLRLAQDNVLGSSVSMQGLGGENVKVLIDGVPVTGRMNGNIDLSQIDLAGIERIELVEGPLSVSYGTNALAGTINLITRKSAKGAASLNASAYAEHIGRLNTAITATRGWGRHETVLSGGRNFFAGWDPAGQGFPSFSPAPADTNRWQPWKPREQWFGRLNHRWGTGRWTLGYKGEGMYDRIVDRGRPRAPYFESAFDADYVTVRLDNALFAEARLPHHQRFAAQLAHNRYARTRTTWLRDLTTLGSELSQAPGAQDTSRFTLSNLRATWSSARDSARIRHEAGIDFNEETGAGDRIGDGGQRIGDYAAFASAEVALGRGIVLRPGARAAWNTRYGAPVIPSVNLRWRLSDRVTLRAACAEGFRAPSLKELYLLFVDVNHDIVGNTDLKAERSLSTSAGLVYRQRSGSATLTAEVNGFRNDVRDLITLALISGTRYSYVNVGRLRTYGGTIGLACESGPWSVSAGSGITYRLDELAASTASPALASPELRATITRQWQRQGWSASLFWMYQGQQRNYVLGADGSVGRGAISAFHLADATVARRCWSERLTITGGCKNVFDVRNLASSMGSGGVHGGGGATVPMYTGRTWFLRLELSLTKSRA
jgi:outer membrane receptor for ferrienterochelin and colicins